MISKGWVTANRAEGSTENFGKAGWEETLQQKQTVVMPPDAEAKRKSKIEIEGSKVPRHQGKGSRKGLSRRQSLLLPHLGRRPGRVDPCRRP